MDETTGGAKLTGSLLLMVSHLLSHFGGDGTGVVECRGRSKVTFAGKSKMGESDGIEPGTVAGQGEVETEENPVEQKGLPQTQPLTTEAEAQGSNGSGGVGNSAVKGAGEGEGADVSVKKLREMQLQILRDKLTAGQALNSSQMKMLAEAEEGHSGSLGVAWAKNQVELAEALGCTRKSVGRYLAVTGNPGTAADGRYDVEKWRAWVAARGTLKAPPKSEKEKLELSILTMTEEAQRLKLEEARGKMVDLDEAMMVLGGICSTLVTELKGMRHTLAPQIVGLTVEEATMKLESAIALVMKEASVPAEAKKKVFWATIAERFSSLQARILSGSGPSGG